MKLYLYQKTNVNRLVSILEKRRGAFDLSATGTGKTVCALNVCKKLGRDAAVIAPLAAVPGWIRTADELNVKLSIVNYESLTKKRGFVNLKKPDPVTLSGKFLVIYDEGHKCKNYKTGNAKTMLRVAKAGHKILTLSATLAHHAEHLRAWNDAFRLTDDYSFSSFMYRCGYYYEKNRWGGIWLPKPGAVEQTKRVIAPFSSCMTTEDAHEMFKKNSVQVEIISSKADKELAKIYADTFRTLRSADKKSSGDHLTKMLRARQASEHAKTDYAAEQLRELVDEGFSVVVFCNFNRTIETLAEELADLNPAQIRGGLLREREGERKRFQENKTFVMLCNIQSGGTGLDLHDINGRPRRTLIFPPLSAVDLKQSLGRVHRAGAGSDCVQRIIFSDVPVERRVAELLREKLTVLDTLHDSETDIFGGKEI